MNEFGKRLRRDREEAGLRLKDLSDAMQWSVVYLSDIERGRRNPPLPEKIREIYKLLGKEPYEALNVADKEKERVELGLVCKSQKITETALLLARSWDGLTDEEAEQIRQILEKEKNK